MSGIPEAPPLDDSKALVPVAPPMDGVPAPPAPSPSSSQSTTLATVSSPPSTTLTTGVPSLEPALNKIQPVPIKKTLMAINNFVINSVEFLNKFTVLCEQKLAKASESVQRLETVITLLEGKLESIDYLAGTGPAPATAAPASSAPAAPPVDGGSAAPPAPPMGDVPSAPPMDAAPEAPKEPERPNWIAPQYMPYFKLLKLRVPAVVVGKKMEREGVDPDIAAAILDAGEEGAAKAIAMLGSAQRSSDSGSDQEEGQDDFD